jgi:hypothetical protein
VLVDEAPAPFVHAVSDRAASMIAAVAMAALLVAIFIEKPPIWNRQLWRLERA